MIEHTQKLLASFSSNPSREHMLKFNSLCYLPVLIDETKPLILSLGSDQFIEATPQEEKIKYQFLLKVVLKEIEAKQESQKQLQNMEEELQREYDKKLKEEEQKEKSSQTQQEQENTKQPLASAQQPKSILKKSQESNSNQKVIESSQPNVKGKAIEHEDGYVEIQEEFVEPEPQQKIQTKDELPPELLNLLVMKQKAFSERNVELYDEIDLKIKAFQKPKPQAIKKEVPIVPEQQKVQFEEQQPPEKESLFKKRQREQRELQRQMNG